mmetsp:Transcript_619/g.1090  ORF Transcript_619/g.1090 Transcript_619/m.1090 type:complete len:102 (-) Transcript_619:509-814(-)
MDGWVDGLQLIPVETDDTLCCGAFPHDLSRHLVLQVQLLQLLVATAGEEKRPILAPLLVDFAAAVQVEGRMVRTAAAAQQKHLALLHEEKHTQANAAAARM